MPQEPAKALAGARPAPLAAAYASARLSYGNLGFRVSAYEAYVARLPRRVPAPHYRDLYLCLGLLRGSEKAFRILIREVQPGLVEAARGAGYPGWFVEEECQALLASLPDGALEGRSPLHGYFGTGSLGGFLRVILLRRLYRRDPRRRRPSPAGTPPAEVAPATVQLVLDAERSELAGRLVSEALAGLAPAERGFLLAHYTEGRPLVEAARRYGLLAPGQVFPRTAASRIHRRLLKRLRARILELAGGRLRLRPGALAELLEFPLEEVRRRPRPRRLEAGRSEESS